VTTCSGSSRRSRFGSVSGALEGDRKSSARPRVPASNPLSSKTGDGMVPSLNEWPRNPHWPPSHASSAAHPHALRLDAAILSRLRSPVTSHSNTGRAIAIDHPRITPAPARRTHIRLGRADSRPPLARPSSRRLAGDHAADVSVISATPAATFNPRLVSTLSGWSAIELLEPPSSALAPTPTATVAPAAPPT
jgi:hypothetical protein